MVYGQETILRNSEFTHKIEEKQKGENKKWKSKKSWFFTNAIP